MTSLFALITVILGLATGYVYTVVPESGLTVLLALSITMGISMAQPKKWWLWALLVAICVPGYEMYPYVQHRILVRGRLEGAIVIALAAGIVGAISGAVMRRMASKVLNPRS